MLDAHTREPITVITERYLGILRSCGWSQPGHNQKLAHLIPEIRVERSHSMFCTNCHKIDITTGYCSWVEIHPYKKPDIQLRLLVQQTGTIIADDLYLCIELVSTATTYLYFHSRVIWINRVRLPNLLVVSCIRGKYIYMYWYSNTAVCIGLYTRYQYTFYLGTCTFIRARFTVVVV